MINVLFRSSHIKNSKQSVVFDTVQTFLSQNTSVSFPKSQCLYFQILGRFRAAIYHQQLQIQTRHISHSDECPCSTGPQTPNHILQSCPTFDDLRRQTWPSPVEAHRKLWGPVETLRQTADFALLTGLKI